MSGHYAVVADLPLGAYRGHLADGSLDPVPAPARLHGALLQAAAQGPRAVVVGGQLEASDEDLAALAWLEENPPDGVVIPRTRRTAEKLTVYRDQGVIRKEGGSPAPQVKKGGKDFTGVVAVAGSFAWTWSVPPPLPVQASLEGLVGDVSHLGTSESPARLHIGTATPTHRLKHGASLLDAAAEAHDLDVALPGRTQALIAHYAGSQRTPSAAQDKYTTSEEPRGRTGWGEARALARYVSDAPAAPSALWDVVLHRSLSGPPVMDEARLAVAVAAHRALIRVIGEGAPSLVTGVYAEGARRPANRVALQVLPGEHAPLAGLDGTSDHLLLLVPHGADPADVAVTRRAFARLADVGGEPGVRRRITTGLQSTAGAGFWCPPAEGARRRWRVDPVAIPEVRSLRSGEWTLGDVVALATALVARDHVDPKNGVRLVEPSRKRGDDRYRVLAQQMRNAGVQVVDASFLRTGSVSHYVHKVPERGVVRPYRALLELGPWAGDGWVTAIGQSRHLGGGLLIPADTASSSGRTAP